MLAHSTDTASGKTPTPVDVAAMQYAANEIPVVVFDAGLGNHKQCGNLVGDASADGDKWHEHVSTDATVIAGWFEAFGARATGIATSPGAADCVVLDVDRPDEVPAHWWPWLDTAPFQSTRSDDGRRGHYWFDQPSGERIGCPAMAWGEVRGDGGGLILSPTRHAKAGAGGRYEWIRQGEAQTLPEAIAAELRTKGQRQGGVVRLVTTTDVSEFIAKHTTTTRPGALAAIVEDFHLSRAGQRKRRGRIEDRTPLNRHDAEFASLCRIARAAAVDKVSASEGREAIETASRENCAQRGEDFQPDDFAHSWSDAVRRALAVDPDVLAARENRAKGTDSRDTTPAIESALALSGITSGRTNVNSPADAGRPDQSADPSGKAVECAEARPPNAPLDLRRLRTEPSKPVAWLLPDVLAHDSYVSLSSAPGTGKSILARSVVVDACLGRSAVDPTEAVQPGKVIYLDAENGEDWWRDGLEAMQAPIDLPNLSVVTFPDLAGLDSDKGANEFLTLISDLAAGMGGEVDLVVLDTVSRFIDGGENDADTWSQFYRKAIQPLRDKHIAVLRLDHLGKDVDRGPRGSSHKLSDVDADYRLTSDKAGSDDLTLTLGKRRRQHFAETVRLRRLDGPLRHEPGTDALAQAVTLTNGQIVPMHPKVGALVNELDALNVAVKLGREKAQTAYKTAGGSLAASAAVWAAAVKFRHTRAMQAAQNGGQQP
ncbi:AAA family ATPase [Mycobacterium sp. NPDC006124]|uniref:AAA family ATPase n=1 Tax=Mycobacterium sp. NPDC006124 TaxID=3156729 RepID=UPI0033BF3AC4